MHSSFAERLLGTIATIAMAIADVVFVARLWGGISFDTAMLTAIVAGIIATVAGGLYLLARLADIEKQRLSI